MKRFLIALLILFSSFFSVFSESYGLVLSGGGGKGAYEVGVWKALKEFGISYKVTAISGTSVGGLNAALFSCSEQKISEEIWKNLVPVFLQNENELISQQGLFNILEKVDLTKINENSFPKVYVTAIREKLKFLKTISNFLIPEPGAFAHRFRLNDEEALSEKQKLLLATSAFPIFTEPIVLKDGYRYSDGGQEFAGGDNTPIDPIVDNEPFIKKIIVVYLECNPKRRIQKIDYDDKEIIEIIPSIDLGDIFTGTMNFNADRMELLIEQGYEDTVKILKRMKLNPVSSYWFS